MINVFQPALGQEELASVGKVFASNWIGKGEVVRDFERAFAENLRADPARFTTTTCCTDGIFLAAEIFDFGDGDEVIAPSISFVAVGSSVVAAKADLVLCDVNPHTLNADLEHIERKISPRTKAIILNHYGGLACDMDPIMELCRAHGITVIEDSACAVKSFYKGRACGTIGEMGLWSFDAMKIIAAGDGGMIYLRSAALLEAAKEHLYLGLPARQTSGTDSSAEGNPTWWEFDIRRPGGRAIMNNITASIALTQLEKLDSFLARRKVIHDTYIRELADCSWLTLPPPPGSECTSSYYLFWIQLAERDAIARFLLEHGVYTTFRYWPLHRVRYFAQSAQGLPNAERACQRTLNLPLHQSLSDDDVGKVIDLVKLFGAKSLSRVR